MASHLSSIGMPVSSEEDFQGLVERVLRTGDAAPVEPGRGSLRWTDPSGAELWVHLDEGGYVVGVTPHFAGRGSLRAVLTREVKRATDSPTGGGLQAWINPPEGVLGSDVEGEYPIVFDVPDFQDLGRVAFPCRARVAVVGFVHELTAYASEEAYRAELAADLDLASKAFIPTGLFGSPDDPAMPEATGLLSGIVQHVERRENALTGKGFVVLTVDSLGGAYDLVADPGVIQGELVEGGVVRAACWLSGRPSGHEICRDGADRSG